MNTDIGDCSMSENKFMTMKMAGEVVAIDLTQPIDVSQMRINFAEVIPVSDEYDRIHLKRTVELFAMVNNDGIEEELTITFELKSQRRPKISKT